MPSKDCPHCSERFDSDGGLRDHSWNSHAACHYCGEQFGDDADKNALYKHWLAVHPDDLRRVDRKQAEAAVDSMSASEHLSHQGVGAAVANLPRRYFLVGGGALAAVGIAGAGAFLTSQSGDGGGETNTVAEFDYAVIGSESAETSITYFGSYKCPFCARFSLTTLQELITEYVEPGDINIVYRNLSYFGGRPFLGSDAPAAGHAGLAVYNNEPETYRDYHEYVFENQPPESQAWATADRLTQFASEAGVSETAVVRAAIQENRYENALQANDSAARDAGVQGTPALVIDGTVATPGQDPIQQLIEDAIS